MEIGAHNNINNNNNNKHPWLMKSGSMLDLQGLFNNPYHEQNHPFLTLIPIFLRSILTLFFHLCLNLSKGYFPVDLPVKNLKALLPSSILATYVLHILKYNGNFYLINILIFIFMRHPGIYEHLEEIHFHRIWNENSDVCE